MVKKDWADMLEGVKKDEYTKGYLAVCIIVVAALWYIFRTVPVSDDVTGGFADTGADLRTVGDGLATISDRAGSGERIADGIRAGVDESAARAERLSGTVRRAAAGAGEAKGGISEAEKRIILAEGLINQSLIRLDESRKILAGYRSGLQEGTEKAGKTD